MTARRFFGGFRTRPSPRPRQNGLERGKYNDGMPRSFSLSQLIVGITWLCFMFGLGVSKNEKVVAYVFTVACFIPAAIIGLVLASYSRRRMTMLIVSIVGGAAGVLWGMAGYHGRGAMTVCEAIYPLFLPMAIHATWGALFFGGIALAVLGPPRVQSRFRDEVA